MAQITELLSDATKVKTKHSLPACAVYFVDKSWKLKDTFSASEGIIIPEIGDIVNVQTNISRSAVGTFTLTLNNKDGRYLVNDDIGESVRTIKENFDQRTQRLVKQTSTERPQIQESIYPHTSARDWLQHENVNDIITVGGQQYVVSLEKNQNTGKSEWVYYKISEGTDVKRVLAPVEFSSDNIRKRRYNQDFYTKYGGSLRKTNPIFEPMMRVVILMSSRFESSPKDMLTVFTGLVDSVVDSYTEGNETLTITGKDVLKWLDISQININPALVQGTLPESGAENLQVYENTFAGKQGWEIISYLIFGREKNKNSGDRELTSAGDFEIQTTSDAGAAGVYSGANVKRTTVRVGEEKYLIGGKEITVTSISELFKHSTAHLQVQTIERQVSTDGKVVDSPIRRHLNSFTNYQALTDYRSRLEICREVARWSNYEFYADQNGDIWFHQPRFSNHWITNAENPEAFVIREEDIISSSFSESDEAIHTSVLITGQMDYIKDMPFQEYAYKHLEEEQTLISKYGRRFIEETSPYLHSNQDCKAYAKAVLQRRNAERRTGTITIPLRPELRIAYTIYVSHKNDIYYVNSVDHSFTWGQQATTTLNLTYGRKPWELLPEVLDYSSTSIMLVQHLGTQGADAFLSPQSLEADETVSIEDVLLIGPLEKGTFRTARLFEKNGTHKGVDLEIDQNLVGSVQVKVVKDGTVNSVGGDPHVVIVRHGDTLETKYCYLDPRNSVGLVPGQAVRAGDSVGVVGFGIEQGLVGPHLHFEVRKRNQRSGFREVDPQLFLPPGYLGDSK